ncbi:ETC complex I subunit [Parasphingopyxis algicola]|uniref:ETC complex I subunit n=1 Tax=Parasphingopyxis algicola TaxID=2026624 RepID=UPI0015A489C5|nr:ETC complex I subunit [Parasphingopyxis algicola]QLC25948.1 ETC complex I subunit [Parasphingopyxis algicola]
MSARIYQRMKNAMQSGRHRVGLWTLEFEPSEAQRADPLTGWAGSSDTNRQVRLTFPTLEAAKAYADKQGIAYHVVPGPEKKLKLQAYADNFR